MSLAYTVELYWDSIFAVFCYGNCEGLSCGVIDNHVRLETLAHGVIKGHVRLCSSTHDQNLILTQIADGWVYPSGER